MIVPVAVKRFCFLDAKPTAGASWHTGAGEDATLFKVMDEDCGVRKAYMLLLGRKNPHSSLTIA